MNPLTRNIPFFLFLLRQGTVGVHSEHGQSPHTQPGPQLDRPHSWRSLWRAVQACEAGHDLQQAPDPASWSPLCKVPLKLCLLCFSKKCLSGNIPDDNATKEFFLKLERFVTKRQGGDAGVKTFISLLSKCAACLKQYKYFHSNRMLCYHASSLFLFHIIYTKKKR